MVEGSRDDLLNDQHSDLQPRMLLSFDSFSSHDGEGPDIIVTTEQQMKLEVQQKHFRSTLRYEAVYLETFWNIGWSVSVFTMNHENQVLIYSGKECYILHLEAVRAFHLGP